MTFNRHLLLDVNATDDLSQREIWDGDSTGLMQLTKIKYPWALQLYKQMRENFWIPEKVDVTGDVVNYQMLPDAEKRVFKGILSYLTFLDSIQINNLFNIRATITAPEINLCLTEQSSQEGLHNHSYQVIIEEVIPSGEQSDVYYFWKQDKTLKKRIQFIANLYQAYLNNPTIENYCYSLIANYLLEGIYFYNGFIFFYTLASRILMAGSVDMIKYINRDELSHVRLFQKMIPEALEKYKSQISQDRILEIFDEAVRQECEWTNHIMNGEILGISEESTRDYTQYLANKRLKAIALPEIYDNVKKSPYQHLERFADIEGKGETKTNFFDGTVTSYNMSSSIDGWNDF